MKHLQALTLALVIMGSAFALSPGHVAAACDPYDTRLCDGKSPDGTPYGAGGIDKVSYLDDRCRMGGCIGFGLGAGGAGGYAQAGVGQQPSRTE